MSLDLGALVGRVLLDDVQFSRTYVSVIRRMSELGVQAERSGGQTTALDKGLADVAASSAAAATGLGGATTALREAGLSASEAAAATNAADTAYTRSIDVTTQAGLAASKLTQAQLRQAAAAARVEELQSKETTSARQLAAAQASLIAADDRVALSQEAVAKSTGATSQAWQGAAHGMVIAGGLVAAGFVYAAKEAAGFDARMALVRTLAKASTSDMHALREAALTVGQAYGFTANQVSDAEAELVKAGISVKDILGGALRGALTLAAAGQEDVAKATETAAIAMTQFRLAGKDVPHIADLLAAGADKALGSVSDLSEALKYGGLAASQAGFSIEQTIGTLAEFAQAGLIGSTAGTALQQMLRNLQKPSVDAAGLMKTLGIAVYDSQGNMLSMSAIAGELHDKIGALPPAQRDAALATLFTARSVRAANILMRDGAAANAEWTSKVNDAGFAALQASGKLDSLSGDFTKLKSALQAAFIGVGEGSSGPLRSLVQDVTKMVAAWNRLPGPVKTSSEVLIAVAGAATLLGGAVLILIPKIAATRTAMTELGISGSRVAGIIGRGGLFLAAITAATMAVGGIDDAMHHTSINADAMSASLMNLARTGQISGEITRAFGADLTNLKSTVDLSGQGLSVFGMHFHSLGQTFTHTGGDFKDARDRIAAVDDALTGLVTSGHADQARQAFAAISEAAKQQGVSVEKLASRFPGYSGALRASGESAKAAGTGIDKYGNAVNAAAASTRKAADAAKAYSDRLHALADPLFAMNTALADLRDKQNAATKAIDKYGSSSRQAKAAQQDLASSALDVETSARTLTAAVDDGSVSMGDARKMLRGWVADGLVARSEAKTIAATWGGLITQAHRLAGSGKAAGRAIGFDFGQGMVIGLSEQTGAVEAQAAKLAMSAAAAAKAAHQSKSPSKVAMRIGRDFGLGLAIGIESTVGLVGQSAARLAHVATAALSDARATVMHAIRAAVAPQVTDPTALSGVLARTTSTAVNRQASANVAGASYSELAEHAKELARELKTVKDATAAHAKALTDQAHAAHEAAANMQATTKAEAAAKHAAEVHARALDDQARSARAAASSSGEAVKSAQHAADAAAKAAERAKNVYDRLSQAAQDAASKAADAAQALVASVSDAVSTMQSQITDFEATIAKGISGDTSIATLWQNLTGTDDQGNPIAPSVSGLQSSLDGILAAAQQFSDDLNKLVADGADQDLTTQLAAMGTTAGDALAQQLIAAGPEAIKALQTTMSAIQSVSDAEGLVLAKHFYGAGAAALDQFIAGLESKFPALVAALAPLASVVDAALGAAPAPAAGASSGGKATATAPKTTAAPKTSSTQVLSAWGALKNIPHFAAGVQGFTGGMALVGEHGPEVVSLPSGSDVYPAGVMPSVTIGAPHIEVHGNLDHVTLTNVREELDDWAKGLVRELRSGRR